MNNSLDYKKDLLRNTDTSINTLDYLKRDIAPDEVRVVLNLFDNAVNPFLDLKNKDMHIDNISNLKSNGAIISVNSNDSSCSIEISSLGGLAKYSYDSLGVSFSLKTDVYEIAHRYRSIPDKYSSLEDLYLKSKAREFEYNLTSGIIYRDRLYDNEREVRSATHDDISDIYLKMFYFVNKADEIVFDNLMDVKVSKK